MAEIQKINSQKVTPDVPAMTNNQAAKNGAEIKQTAENTLDKKEEPKLIAPKRTLSYYLPWITGVLGAAWITQVLLVSVISSDVNKQRTEIELAKSQNLNVESAAKAISESQSDIDILIGSFPEEQGIIEFINQVKLSTAQFTGTHVEISNNEPIQSQNLFAPFLPVTLSVEATASALTPFMDEIANSEFLFQPVRLELNALGGLEQSGKFEYKGNLFVSDELIK